MPKQTFWNLPEEKRTVIVYAAKKEFSRVPFTSASINQIIKDANISRGSFYMYFEDKEDLLMHVLAAFQERVWTQLLLLLKTTHGILTQVVLGIHDYFYQMYLDKENQKFVTHMMLYFQSSMESENCSKHGKQPLKEALFRIAPLIDASEFAFQQPSEINAIIDIAFSTLKSVLVNTFMQNLSFEESRVQLLQYLKIIQYGYQLRKEE